jgi:hypothetical protein
VGVRGELVVSWRIYGANVFVSGVNGLPANAGMLGAGVGGEIWTPRAFTRVKDDPFGSVLGTEALDEEGVRSTEKTKNGPITNRPQVTNLPHKCFRINVRHNGRCGIHRR